MHILAIDPGNKESGYALIDQATCRPIDIGKISNDQLLRKLRAWLTCDHPPSHVAIEMVASYGMPVGKEVFETCVWIGRYQQVCGSFTSLGTPCDLIYRRDIKLHHCHTSKAKDTNITQALVDRFASGVRNRGKGTLAAPGWFYGFRADIWQAYALAVYTADTITAAADVRSGSYAREVAS